MHPQIAKPQRKIRSSHSQTNQGALSCHSNDDSLAPLCTEMKMARLSSVFSYFPRFLLNSAYPQGPTWRPCPGEAKRWVQSQGFPGGSGGKEPACHCRRHRFEPSVGKILWRRAQQPTPVILPREFHGQRSLAGYSPRDCKESDMTEATWACTHARADCWDSVNSCAAFRYSGPQFLLVSKGLHCTHPSGW